MKATFESGAASALRNAHEATPPWLRRYTKLVAASTLFLIFAGAMVTSTGSGLAVPDWPNTYGWFMFAFPLSKMVGGIFYEHSHRLIAATVGFMTIIQAVWLQLREPKRHVRTLGWIALAAVIVQGALGGLTVIFLLPQPVSIAHAGLAEIFFCLNVAIAFFTSRLYVDVRNMEKGDAPVRWASLLVGVVYAQILIGAVMRHRGAGLAIPDFPLSFGKVIPPFASVDIAVNYAHRVGAMVVALGVIVMFLRLRRFEDRHPLRQIVLGLVLIVPLQILLGGYTVWSGKSPVTTSIHVMTGASTLALALLLALTARAVVWRRGRETASERFEALATPHPPSAPSPLSRGENALENSTRPHEVIA